jgi:hypothetical protein
MAIPSVQTVLRFARRLDELLALDDKFDEALSALDQRLRGIEDRLTRLEAQHDRIVTEARSAATAASTMVAGGIIAEVVTRLTRAEQKLEAVGQTTTGTAPPKRLRRRTAADEL